MDQRLDHGVSRRRMLLGTAAAVIGVSPNDRSSDEPLSLRTVIDRHTRARGGAAALEKRESLRVALWITERAHTITATYICTRQHFRIDVRDGARRVFSEGLDADGPWLWPADANEPRQGVDDAKRTGLQGIETNIYGLHQYAARGHRVHLAARERIAGVDWIVLEVSFKESYSSRLYIDPCTWMIVRRRDFRAPHPDIDATREAIEVQYGDFRLVNGVATPFVEHQVRLRDGAITQLTGVQSLEYNASFSPETLTRAFRPL